VYRKFIRTRTFVNWFKLKKRSAILQIRKNYSEFLKSYDVAPLLKGKSEIEIVDLYLRARTFCDKQSATGKNASGAIFSTEMKKRYQGILDQFLGCLPIDLQQSLHVKRKVR